MIHGGRSFATLEPGVPGTDTRDSRSLEISRVRDILFLIT